MWMVRMADIVDPADLALLAVAVAAQPISQRLRIFRVALTSHGQRLEPDQQLLRRARAECAPRVPQDLKLAPHRERPPAELLP